MLTFSRTNVTKTMFYRQWDCFAYSSDGRYHPGVGYPCLGSSSKHHVIVNARNERSANRKVDRILRKNSGGFL